MCFKQKWTKFEPTDKYLLVVKPLTSVVKLYNFIQQFQYTGEKGDIWQTPEEFLKNEHLDCLEENTRILIKGGIKKIKDLKLNDLILSYNYNKEQYEYKKVINVWDKGILDGYYIKLKNGQYIIATGNHRFYCRTGWDDYPEKYKIKRFKDINLDCAYKRQLHCVHLLPEGDIDFNKDLAYIYGIYLAEGYVDKNNGALFIAQDKKDIRKKIERALDNLNVPYSKSKRKVHSYYGIRKSYVKEHLRKLGTNSFNKKLPMEVLNWNKPSIKKLIEGMLNGDGTDCTKYKNNFADGHNHNALWEYSTSSEELAKMFNIIVRKVYGHCHYYKQLNHQGVGKNPIWRLRFNTNSLPNRREIYKGIGTVSIARKYSMEVKNKHYYDIEIEDNHNFILADSGVISHNCDDFMRFTVDVLKRVMGIEARGVISSGYNKKRWGKKKYCHAITVFPYRGKFALFSNNAFRAGFADYTDACKYTFPDGLKFMEIRDWQGKILERKYNWIGIF